MDGATDTENDMNIQLSAEAEVLTASLQTVIDKADALFAEAHQEGGWSALGMPEEGDVNSQTQFGKLVWRSYSDREHAIYFDGRSYTAVGDVNGLVGFRFTV